MNSRDSEFMADLCLKKGYKLIDSPNKADIILFNTCSVREHAEERAVHSMGNLMHRHPNRTYGIVGCGAQALKSKLFDKLPELDIVCGTGQIHKMPDLIKTAQKRKVLALSDVHLPLPEVRSSYRENEKHAYVSIMRGCNNFCTYCIVPYVRGRERSRKVEDIVREIEDLVKIGIKNVTLLGQNVNSYKGKNEQGKIRNFVELLGIINAIEGLENILFFTSHPKDANSKLFKAMRDLPKVVKHLHLPLQSGSDKILKLMARKYSSKKYKKLINDARKIIPNLKVTTDIIVGFPKEKEKDFKDTLKLMQQISFDAAYLFKYSKRSGTRAASMKDDVPVEVKKRRHRVLLELQRNLFASRKGKK